jgi:arginine:ornithine antiporter/lysine permease
VIQLFLVSTLFSDDAFALMVKLSSAMVLVPYLLVAAYGFLLALRRETYGDKAEERARDLLVAGVATLYAIFMIYAGGLKFLLLSAILYAPGTALYFQIRREQRKPVFVGAEWIVFIAAAVGCLLGIYGVVSGEISI